MKLLKNLHLILIYQVFFVFYSYYWILGIEELIKFMFIKYEWWIINVDGIKFCML
jgi:hypothetical protein